MSILYQSTWVQVAPSLTLSTFLQMCTLGGSTWWLNYVGSCWLHAPNSWFPHSKALAFVGIWGINVQVKDLHSSFCLILSAFQMDVAESWIRSRRASTELGVQDACNWTHCTAMSALGIWYWFAILYGIFRLCPNCKFWKYCCNSITWVESFSSQTCCISIWVNGLQASSMKS